MSRDSDFGATFDDRVYVNDHLRQEFGDRVSKKRKLLLYSRLAEALKHFAIPVTEQEVEAETEIVQAKTGSSKPEPSSNLARLIEIFDRIREASVQAQAQVNNGDG